LVPFEACLEAFFAADTVELFNPSVQQIVPSQHTTRFKTFPRYLMVKLRRYYVGPNWVQKKIVCRVDVPEYLDLSPYRALGPQPHLGEVAMPETADTSSATAGEHTLRPHNLKNRHVSF
jgi:ubiquitin carboxyl-terminal hydrolase 5/13